MENNINLSNRTEYLKILSEKFYIYLINIKPLLLDKILFDGTQEGRNKILSNLDLTLKKLNKIKHFKYVLTDYYSEEAYEQIKNNRFKGLIYEHMLPKNIYQNEIFNSIKSGNIPTQEELFNILKKYWLLATITKEQDNLLTKAHLRTKMPIDWNKENIFARYQTVGIKLIKTSYFN